MIVNGSEIEDFHNTILSRGFELSDFEFTEKEDPMHGLGVQPITGHVTVRRKSNNVSRTYRAGHWSHWVADFDEDLKRGVFA
jgi:hypothetical protein